MNVHTQLALVGLLILAACGGGRSPSTAAAEARWPEAAQPLSATPAAFAARKRAAGTTTPTDAAAVTPDQLFNWAQRAFPQYFPHHAATQQQGAWTYRAYFDTGVMLGMKAGEVHVVGGPFGMTPLRVGRASDFISPAIAVKKTSYENKTIDMAPRVLPIPPRARWDMQTWHGRAFADFEQTGSLSYFVATARNSDSNLYARGTLFFYRFNVDGSFTDITGELLDGSDEGCISPMRALVADFNQDGRPDVFLSCTGPDYDLRPQDAGENSKVILSQPDGRYKALTLDLGGHGYPHGATVADIDGDGYPDIVLADVSQLTFTGKTPVYALINQRDGRFVKTDIGFDFLRGRTVWTVEMVDIDGDGVPELWIGSGYEPDRSVRAGAFYRLQNKAFVQTPMITAKPDPEYALDYDIVARNGRIYVLSHDIDYTAPAIAKVSLDGTVKTVFVNRLDFGTLLASRPECRGIATTGIDIIRLYQERIVTDDACRNPALPFD